jgi:transposase
MGREKRLYPISEEKFTGLVLPIIQASYRGKGRPPEVSHYKVFCGILYILRTGCPWREVPLEYGYWHVGYDRFSRGSERGLWAKILLELQKAEGIRFPEVIMDSTTMKVHRHGGRTKGGQQTKGVSRAGMSTKFHLAITTSGQVVEGFLSGGNMNDIEGAPELVKEVAGCAVMADRGYDSDEFRRILEGNNTIPVIPGRKNRKEAIAYDKQKYRKRSFIERIFGKIKENRRLTVRYEKTDMNFLGSILIAFLKILLC